MFGPNTHLNASVRVSESHRDLSFRTKLSTLRDEFVNKFNLHEFEIAFMLGGGSLGIESMIYSLRSPVRVLGVEGAFTQRWRALAAEYERRLSPLDVERAPEFLYCQLETSVSEFQTFPNSFVDAVSSFPYRPIPGDAQGFVTSSNKILGSLVGLVIVGVRKEICGDLLRNEDSSYLSVKKYFRYLSEGQTPTTTATHNVEHLLEQVRSFDLQATRDKIDRVSDMLTSCLGKEFLIGSSRGPVLTVRQDRISTALAERWSLYSKPTFGGVYQIFTYSCDIEDYARFCAEVEAGA